MSTNNSTILAHAWLNGTNDYQQRVPDPTQSSIKSTSEALLDPMNRNLLNQFMDVLINRIGFTYVKQKTFENPLAVFKDGKMDYGSTIQVIYPNWIKAHSYNDSATDLLKMWRPDADVFYVSQNRQDQYPITITHDELRTAFADDYGLNQLVASVLEQPINSDNYDEYRAMLQLVGIHENKWGMFKHHTDTIPQDETSGKEFLKSVREYAGMWHFPSTLYSALKFPSRVPVFAPTEELVLFTTPQVLASLSVEVLASIFHVELADINIRVITVDQFPVDGVYAILTTQDFYVAKDTLYENTSFFNPSTLGTTYYLNHWQALGINPIVPVVAFTTKDESTIVPTITQTVTSFELKNAYAINYDGYIMRDEDKQPVDGKTLRAGEKAKLFVSLTGTLQSDDEEINLENIMTVEPKYSTTWEITATDASGNALTLNSRTYVDKYNILHTQKTLPTGTTLTLEGISTYQNPNGETEDFVIAESVTIDNTLDRSTVINY